MTSLDTPPTRQQFSATVAANNALCREHYRLVLRLPNFPRTRPGQFIQIACRDTDLDDLPAERMIECEAGRRVQLSGRELMTPLAMLRRPFSLADQRDTRDGVELEIIHRVLGVGTDWLAHLQSGQRVSILGPLGNCFTLPTSDQTAILVGGGVGIPPMLYLAGALRGARAIAFCGATSRELLPLTIADDATDSSTPAMRIAEFARHAIPSIITTDDGSLGIGGFVTHALEQWLDSRAGAGQAVIYTCGPEPMMKRVAEIALARNIPCQVAVERAMACGMGTCQSCVIRTRADNDKGWVYKLACTDGPIFNAADLLW